MRRALSLLLILLAAGPAVAADTKAELQDTHSKLAASKARADKLKRDLSALEGNLEALQKESSALAAQIQDNEQQRHELGQTLAGLQEDEKQKQLAITQHRKEIGAMLASAIRMGQVPPHAVLAIPGGLETEIHASRTLAMTAGGVKQKLDALGEEIAEIERLRAEIDRQNRQLDTATGELALRRKELDSSLGARRLAMKGLYAENQKEQQRMQELTRKSTDLASLVDALEAERKKQMASDARRSTSVKSVPFGKGEARKPIVKRSGKRQEFDLAAAKGRLRLPVSGQLGQSYGTQRGVGDTLRGMELSTGGEAVVTSPYRGEVLFTGPFLDYGRMIIIRHSRQYHILLAGLKRIDATPGQFLLEGEPIGVMGEAKEERRLYVELRENGKPIDPAPWFGGGNRFARR